MSIRIDFYLLPERVVAIATGLSIDGVDKIATACRLIEKAYQAGHQVYVHTDSVELAKQADTALWTFRDISFVPHALAEENQTCPSPIIIGTTISPTDHNDLLVNLTDSVPVFYTQFHRVIEIVPSTDSAKQAARKKYKIYKEAGCELHSHQLEK